MVLHELDPDLLRAEMIEMACYDPDDEDDDGETDATPSGLWFHDPDDETQEIDVDPVRGPADDYDDDRRRFEGEQLLHLTESEHDVVDDLLAARVPLTGIGSRCAWTPHPLPAWAVADGLAGVRCRPSPVIGGTFVIFPD